ncbi:MAG: hypothetical protein V4760_00755 [Bdellovibrionota bacterium]
MRIALSLLLSFAAFAGNTSAHAEGLPKMVRPGALVLKCYDVVQPKATWNNWKPKAKETDLEKFRVSDTKFAFKTLFGGVVIETEPNVTATGSDGISVLVAIKTDLGKFIATEKALVNIDGVHGSIVGSIADSHTASGDIQRVAVCGFKQR